MHELDRLNGLLERQGLRLEAEVRRIGDLLRDLARMSRFLARESSPADDEVDAWIDAQSFVQGAGGWMVPRAAPGNGHAKGRDLLVLWRAECAEDDASRRLVHRHRRTGEYLAGALKELPALRRVVLRTPCGVHLAYPSFDASRLAEDAFDAIPLVRALGGGAEGPADLRWGTPIHSPIDAAVVLYAGLPVDPDDPKSGAWLVEVALDTLFAEFSASDGERGEERLFVVNAAGDFLFEESYLEAPEAAPGERLRGSLFDLGGEHWQLDLADMRGRGRGRIELLAEDGRHELLVFRRIEGTSWLCAAEISRSVLLVESNRRIEAALRSVGTGDFSQRVDIRGLGERMQNLAEAYNEMAASLQREERVRREAEDALAEEERRGRLIAEVSPVGIFRVDRNGELSYHNRRAAELAGVPHGELATERWEHAIHPDDRGRVLSAWRKAMVEHGEFRCEHRYLHDNGAVVWVQAEARPERDRKDQFLGMVGTTTDISERKREELRRRSSQEHLATLLDSIAEGVLATDGEGRVTRMNPPAEDLLGWSEREALGRRLPEVLRFTSGPDAAAELVRPCVDECRKLEPSSPRQLVDRHGRTRRVERSAAPLRDEADHVVGAVICLRDVTERLEWSERVARARRLEAVGQLAAGIAHDFQNLLTGIGGEAEAVALALGEDSEHMDRLLSIVQAADRANHLARELFAFAPGADRDVVPLSPEALLRELEERLRPTLGPRVQLDVEVQPDLPRFIGDATQLGNALLNVATNARDAIVERGTITLSARREHLEPKEARERGLSAGDHVVLTVRDDGQGMSPETRAHLFEPFYTTRTEPGAGLGLAAVEACVGRHGGRVEVDSAVGSGTAIRMWFPATREPAVTLVPHAPPEIRRGSGHVLLVDDEDIVRNFAARSLRDMGYEVTACGDGERALELYDARPEAFDLVLMDLVMPGMGGEELFEELRRRDRVPPVLITSGYGEEPSVRGLLDRGAAGFLEKPFRVHELSQAVARHVAGSRVR